MNDTSHLIQGISGLRKSCRSQMNIDGCGSQRLMPKISLNSKKISSIFIEMRAKCMAERMAGDTPWPSESVFMLVDMPGKKKGVNRTIRVVLFWEQPSSRSVIFKPVFSKDIQSKGRKLCIPIAAVFAMSNMNPHMLTINMCNL